MPTHTVFREFAETLSRKNILPDRTKSRPCAKLQNFVLRISVFSRFPKHQASLLDVTAAQHLLNSPRLSDAHCFPIPIHRHHRLFPCGRVRAICVESRSNTKVPATRVWAPSLTYNRSLASTTLCRTGS
jgi:hypothetical protein